MEVHIFSLCGYAHYARKAYNSGSYGYGMTKECYNRLAVDVTGETTCRVKEIASAVVCDNDFVLMDREMLALALPSMSGLATVKLIEVSGNKSRPHMRVSDGLPLTVTRSDGTPCRALSSSIASSALVCVPDSQGATLSHNVPAPMTSVITCRPKVKCWPGTLPHTTDAADAQVFKCLKEAVVVPLNTMRLLGAAEGSVVRLECYDETKLQAAATVVFSLVSGSVGEELSIDSYLRHFIAPFFLKHSRAISLGEEFEMKNYNYGQLHVTVIAINDGDLKCGLVTDASRIRVVVQPAALPKLQGHEISPVLVGTTPQRCSSCPPKRPRYGCGSQLQLNISCRNLEASSRPTWLFSAQPSTSGGALPFRRESPHVFAPSPRRSSRSAEPHNNALFSMYTPETVNNSQVHVVRHNNMPLLPNGLKYTREEETLGSNSSVAVDTSVTPIGDIHSLRKQKSDGVHNLPVESLQQDYSFQVPDEASLKTPSKPDINISDGSFAYISNKPPVTANASLHQDKRNSSYTLSHQGEEQTGCERHMLPKDQASSIHSVPPDTVMRTEGGCLPPDLESTASKNRCFFAFSGKLDTTINPDTQEDICLMRIQKDSETLQVDTLSDIFHKSSEATFYEAVPVSSRQEQDRTEGVFHPNETHAPVISDANLSVKPVTEKKDVYTQYETHCNINLVDVQKKAGAAPDVTDLQPVTRPSEKVDRETPGMSNVISEKDKEDSEGDCCANDISKSLEDHTVVKETPEKQKNLNRIEEKACEIIQRWLELKAWWQEMPVSPLLKCEPYTIIKRFQYFIALYKELKQRHMDCLAYLDSPYGHTLRGNMVLRISLFPPSNEEAVDDGTGRDTLQTLNGTHDESFIKTSDKGDDANDGNSESTSVVRANELLKLKLRTVSAALGTEILHIFRVGGTRPALYCTLMKPYMDGPDKIFLMGEPYRVEVLRWTIMEDLCEAREESRREWVDLSIQWTEAVSSVLRLGVFTEHMKSVHQLLWEFALILRHPGGVRWSTRQQRGVNLLLLNEDNSALHIWKKKDAHREMTTCLQGQTVSSTPEKVTTTSSIQSESFFFYLRELQDTYYLYSELLEPFVLDSMQRLDVISAVTDAMQCKEMIRFLDISYKAQLAEEEEKTKNGKNGMRRALAAAKEERDAFIDLVEARRAGVLMPLPEEWWGNCSTKG